jgi:hypothetical protein
MAHLKKRQVVAGDFVERCELQGVANATSVATFLTTQPLADNIQLVSL